MSTTVSSLPPIAPLATMKAAWTESARLGAESARLGAESDLVVILTAQALYGKDVQIDWESKTAKPYEERNA